MASGWAPARFNCGACYGSVRLIKLPRDPNSFKATLSLQASRTAPPRPTPPGGARSGSKIMVVLPVVKLGTLALKTLCKPIASKLKKEAGLHPKFRQFIISIAQANHQFSTNLQRRIYGHATNVEIRPLNEEKAVQAAADLIGELFIFTVAGAAVIFEVQRSSRSEARKEELRKRELEAMRHKEDQFMQEVEILKHKINELEQLARGQGLSGILRFRNSHASEGGKAGAGAS